MLKALMLGGIAASAWGPVQAQVPPEVREKLLAGEVVTHDAQVYAMAAGIQRGTREGSQELLVTRAMRSIANKLCALEAAPGQRLEASLQGVTLVSSETRGNEMAVVIKAPVQKPTCHVRVVEPVRALPAVPVPTEAARTEDTQTRLVEPVEPRAQDIVIRKFGGEY